MKVVQVSIVLSVAAFVAAAFGAQPAAQGLDVRSACYGADGATAQCLSAIAHAIVVGSSSCYHEHQTSKQDYESCARNFCDGQCNGASDCGEVCASHAFSLFANFSSRAQPQASRSAPNASAPSFLERSLRGQAEEAAKEQQEALIELKGAQARLRSLSSKMQARVEQEMKNGNATEARAAMQKLQRVTTFTDEIEGRLQKVERFEISAQQAPLAMAAPSFLQQRSSTRHRGALGRRQLGQQRALVAAAVARAHRSAPEDELAEGMEKDLKANFNKIAPFGKEDTARELQDHAAKTQDTLVDAVENAEVAEIKRAVFRSLTRLRAATIKEFDTVARLETQAIDAYNDAHHYRAENPLEHLHSSEPAVESDKLSSFH